MVETPQTCRSCGGASLELVLDLGEMPLADGLLKESDLSQPEPHYPLAAVVCADCGLMQLRDTVDPDELFCREYPYFSSFSPAILRHSQANVEEMIKGRGLGPESLVVELASNDGYLLQYYVKNGVPVLGIDPSDAPVRAARQRGIETLNRFFTADLARELRDGGTAADVIHANNVLAHVPDLNGFVEGIDALLAGGGIAVVEVPHVLELIRHCQFDTIYHEHHCYFSVGTLRPLFARHGLTLNDARAIAIHGGSLRLYVSRELGESDRVGQLLEQEAAAGLDTPAGYRSFGEAVAGLRESLRALMDDLAVQGARIAAYGAAAKGATLLNYVGIGTEELEFVVDRNVHKHGLYMPGTHLPIHPTEHLIEAQPDYTLLLSWNFRDEILEQQAEYRERGGRFIIPGPEPVIV